MALEEADEIGVGQKARPRRILLNNPLLVDEKLRARQDAHDRASSGHPRHHWLAIPSRREAVSTAPTDLSSKHLGPRDLVKPGVIAGTGVAKGLIMTNSLAVVRASSLIAMACMLPLGGCGSLDPDTAGGRTRNALVAFDDPSAVISNVTFEGLSVRG